MSNLKTKAFEKQTYLSLETFRKNGQGVPTPVWFAENNGVLYITTVNDSGKVKRIRNNGRVRIAPCDMRGGLLGEWFEAQARLVSDSQEAEMAKKALDHKYGLQKRIMELASAGKKIDRVYLAVEVK
jgi:PPOX class probable F420-dependent enzyme